MLYDWLQNIEFANKWLLPFLGMLPVFAWLHFRTQSSQAAFTVTTTDAFKETTARNILVHIPFWLRLLAIGCVILALARPQIRNQQTQTKGEGIAIVLCIDVSGSMLSADFYPNRLEVAKQVAADFVKARPVDQIGLVIFSGESYTLCPITTDKNTLITQVSGLRSGMLQDGTLIGEGLATSVDRLTKSDAKSKVVILLTDGSNNTGSIPPITAAEIAKQFNVRVYTVGIGTHGFAPYPVQTSQGIQYQRIPVDVDEGTLTKIANITGGKYFRATDNNKLKQIYEQIDKLEKAKIDVTQYHKKTELFLPFAIIALLFVLLEFGVKNTILKGALT